MEKRSGIAFAAIRAAVLDGSVYRSMTESPEHMLRALGVVLATSIAFGLGVRNTLPVSDESAQWLAVLIPASTVLLGWVVWTFITYVVGTLLLGGNASSRLLQRGIGLAHAPGVLLMLSGVPAVGIVIFALVHLWMLAAAIVAVREIQGSDWVKAFIPTTVGWIAGELLLRIAVFRFVTGQPG